MFESVGKVKGALWMTGWALEKVRVDEKVKGKGVEIRGEIYGTFGSGGGSWKEKGAV